MKRIFLTSAAALAIMSMVACSNETRTEDTANTEENTDMLGSTADYSAASPDPNRSYIDLTTGEDVHLQRDEQNGYVVNMRTSEPVEFYVDMSTQDTFYGKTGAVVNNALLRTGEGSYELDDAKIEWEGDEMKIKTDETKEKWEDDEYKYKSDDIKIKREGDEAKIKTDDMKVKKEGDEIKVKTDD